MEKQSGREGFSLMEALIVLGVIAAIQAIVIIAVDPVGNASEARNAQRRSNVNKILDGVFFNIIDNGGEFVCKIAGEVPQSPTFMKQEGGYNIAPCLVPRFLTTMPSDPSAPGAHYTSRIDYDSGYQILKNPATGRIIVMAPHAELSQEISVGR